MKKEIENITNSSLNAEERIIEAATEIFAEKGYDAAGVDEIAKRANVTKPLIYYYFKGKKTILEELIKRYMKKVIQEKEQYVDSITTVDKEMLYKRLDEKAEVFSNNSKVLKVIAMELLKEKPVGESILSMVNPMFDIGIPKIEEMGVVVKDKMDLIVTSFFFGTLPTLVLMLFGDKFCQFYHIDREELNKRFFNVMKSMYIDYFIDSFEERKDQNGR